MALSLTLTLKRRPSLVSCALLDYDRRRRRHGLGFKGQAGLDHVTSAQAPTWFCWCGAAIQ